jgi:tripartite-type tricarboxylate transporter receptor subunit TctC
MVIGTFGLAFLAGLLSVLSPCVLPLLPIVLGAAAMEHRMGPAALAGGVALSFVAIGLFVATAGFAIGLEIEFIRAGKLRPLAVTTAMRSVTLPDVPTVGEFVTGYEASGWYGISAPKSTPAQIIEKLNKEINAGLADPMMKARLANLGGAGMPMTPADFGKLIADETGKWDKVIRAANIKP